MIQWLETKMEIWKNDFNLLYKTMDDYVNCLTATFKNWKSKLRDIVFPKSSDDWDKRIFTVICFSIYGIYNDMYFAKDAWKSTFSNLLQESLGAGKKNKKTQNKKK